MKTKIKVHAPDFKTLTIGNRKGDNVVNIELTAYIEGGLNSASVEIDFNNLLSFANLASINTVDFFLFTAATYGIDRFIERRRNSVDGWSRDFEIEFPVSDVNPWNSAKEQIERMLSFLTGDYWSISFYKSHIKLPNKPLAKEFEGQFSKVNLFSGGLDSLIGALDHLKLNPQEKLILISHYDKKMGGPMGDQRDLLKIVQPIFDKGYAHIPSINVSLEDSTLKKTETTLRSRSLLFNGMALIVAEGKGLSKIVVPENGSVSLNFPLSPSRRSACSTRTTHPSILDLINEIWQELGFNISVYNPYEFKTKGEMVTNCADQISLGNMISTSNSCGKRGHRAHWVSSGTHCGICMPCVYRRAALLTFDDKTKYGNEMNSLNFHKKKGRDMSALLNFLGQPLTKKDIKTELIVNGIRDLIKLDKYIDLVDRTRRELSDYISKFGNTDIKKRAGL